MLRASHTSCANTKRQEPSILGRMKLPSGDEIADMVNAPSLHKWSVVMWTVLLPVSYATGWLQSTVFISFLSLVALVLSSGAWWVAARLARKVDANADVAEVLTLLRKVERMLDERGQ